MLAYFEIRKDALKHFKSASLYAMFGLCALVLELVIFFAAIEKGRLNVLAANTIAVISGMFVSFGLNAAINFKVSDNLLTRFASYAGIVGLGYLLSTGLIALFIFANLEPFAAKLLTLPFVFLFQYGLNQRFTFSRQR